MPRNVVWVYRNLKHGRKAPPLYSIMKDGRVVRRVRRILLQNCRFVVREGGRQRVLNTKHKNVHAFVVGTPVGTKGVFGIDKNGRDLPARIRYNPYTGPNFMWGPCTVTGARAVLLNENGISACYLS